MVPFLSQNQIQLMKTRFYIMKTAFAAWVSSKGTVWKNSPPIPNQSQHKLFRTIYTERVNKQFSLFYI